MNELDFLKEELFTLKKQRDYYQQQMWNLDPDIESKQRAIDKLIKENFETQYKDKVGKYYCIEYAKGDFLSIRYLYIKEIRSELQGFVADRIECHYYKHELDNFYYSKGGMLYIQEYSNFWSDEINFDDTVEITDCVFRELTNAINSIF